MSLKLRLNFKDLTELIVYTGYEDRLVQGRNISSDHEDPFSWFTRDKDNDYNEIMTPLLTGGRIIYPEELDKNLSKSLKIKTDVKWKDYEREIPEDVQPCSIDDLFSPYEFKSGKAEKIANSNFARRIKLVNGLKDIMGKDKDLRHIFREGLILRLRDSPDPLSILSWIEDNNYFSGASALEFDEITIIQDKDHKILIVHYDAESG